MKVPTLVLHCRDEVVVPFEEGRLLAASIPGARFVALEGRNHLLLESEPAWPKFVAEVRRFLETEPSEAKRERSPSTDSFDRRGSDHQTTIETASGEAIRTGETTLPAVTSSTDETARPTVISSNEFVAGEIKHNKTLLAGIATIVVLVVAALIYSYVTAKRGAIDSLAGPGCSSSGSPTANGTTRRIAVPVPGVLCRVMSPPISVASRLQITSPRPVPP